MTLHRRVEVRPAYDHTADGEHGWDSAQMYFVVIGAHGAVGLTVDTGWALPGTLARMDREHRGYRPKADGRALHFHHAEAGKYPSLGDREECEWLAQGFCYGDVSFVAADMLYATLVEKGLDALWVELEGWYRSYYEGESGKVETGAGQA